ncbi:MAG: hypothetical protein QUS12_11620 [Methanosarcina sp.]|nr:hypothetical protein [Methanosarcina sp.]
MDELLEKISTEIKKSILDCFLSDDYDCRSCPNQEACNKIEKVWGNESEMTTIEVTLPQSMASELQKIIPLLREGVRKGIKTDSAVLGHVLVGGINQMSKRYAVIKAGKTILNAIESGTVDDEIQELLSEAFSDNTSSHHHNADDVLMYV